MKVSDLFSHYFYATIIWKFFELIGLQSFNDWMKRKFDDYIDTFMANTFTSLWDRNMERIATAPMKIISDGFVYPDENITVDRQKFGHRTAVSPIECWLTDESIDYSIFFDYYIDPKIAKDALSRILSKTPIIGGVWVQINETTIGIDHSNTRIPFVHAMTDYEPSTNYKDYEQPYYYTKYTNGANKRMPFPKGKHVFKITMTHYPKPSNNDNDDEIRNATIGGAEGSDNANDKFNTLIAVGCSHALCDAEALFVLLRGWASEMRGVGDDEYSIPDFSRHRLILDKNEIKQIKPTTSVLGKHFGHSLNPTAWYMLALWPARRWSPRTWTWDKKKIDALKQAAFNGKAGAKLKEIGRISGNDVLTALYWKLNATLNNGYDFNRPIMCTMVINTRKWIPDRFPKKNVNYFGNALAFLVLHESRGNLINSDFSEVVLKVRSTVKALSPDAFETDLSFYTHLTNLGVKYRPKYQGRWAVGDNKDANDPTGYGGFWHCHYLHNRDMMVSNLMKLDTHSMDMGQGHPTIVRFNHRDEPTNLTYLFKKTREGKEFEFYGSFPNEYQPFFEKYDIQDPNLNWDEINKNYVKKPHWFRNIFREYPMYRACRIYPKRDCCSGRRDKKSNFMYVEL